MSPRPIQITLTSARFHKAHLIGCVLICFVICCGSAKGQVSYKKVALTRDAAPGTNGVFLDFSRPTLNAAGQAAFVARIAGAGIDDSDNQAIFSEASGTLELVAREGTSAPGTGFGVSYSSLGHPRLNAAGSVAFQASFSGFGVNDENDIALYSGQNGDLNLLARDGDAAPGTGAGVNYNALFGFANLRQNDSGTTAFFGFLDGNNVNAGNSSAIFSNRSGELDVVVRAGDTAPDNGANVNFGGFEFNDFVQNSSGKLAFDTRLVGAGVSDSTDLAVFSEGSGSLRLVAREGTSVITAGPGVVYEGFDGLRLNDSGQAAFHADLTGFNTNSSNDEAILIDNAGDLSILARAGDQAIGLGQGVNYLSFPTVIDNNGVKSRLTFNNQGQIGFRARLSGAGVGETNDEALFYTSSEGEIELLLQEGDAVPGMEEGVVFTNPALNGNMIWNDLGNMVLQAEFVGPGIDESNDFGLFFVEGGAVGDLIIRQGQLFDVDDDPIQTDFREVLSFRSASDVSDSFNNNGEFVFHATFTDGSEGIFVASTSAVPEPSTVSILAVGVLGLAARRRKRA